MAKIYGTLERAQLELIAGDASTTALIGRTWFNTSSNKMKVIDNATNVLTVLTAGGALIVDADVNASAAIAGTKVSPDFGSQNVTTTGNLTGAILKSTSAASSGKFIGFQSPSGISASITYTLPSADGSNGQLLQTNGSAVLSWVSSGNVGGPGSSTDRAIATYSGTSGTTLRNTGVIIDASNNMSGIAQLSFSSTTSGSANAIGTTMTSTGADAIASSLTVAGALVVIAQSGSAPGSWTPTLSCKGSMTIGTTSILYARFTKIGKLCFFQIRFSGTLGGTPDSAIYATVPVAAGTFGVTSIVLGTSVLNNASVELSPGTVRFDSDYTKLAFQKSDVTNFSAGAIIVVAAGFFETT